MQWKGFQKPKRLEIDQDSATPTWARFSAQPFERGFGTTIGNALRRTRPSSTRGAPVAAVRIVGVRQELSSIPGVVEDVTDIILNLKRIPTTLHVDHPEMLRIKVEGPCEVKSGDIEAGSNIEILDSDAHVATISEAVKL